MSKADTAAHVYANAFDAVTFLAALATIIVGGVYAKDNGTKMSIILATLPIYWIIQSVMGFAARGLKSRMLAMIYTGMIVLGMLFFIGMCVALASYRNQTLDKVLDLDSKTSTGFFYKTYQAFRDYTKPLAGLIGASAVLNGIMGAIMSYYMANKEGESSGPGIGMKGSGIDMGNLGYGRGSGISAAYAPNAGRSGAGGSSSSGSGSSSGRQASSNDVVYV